MFIREGVDVNLFYEFKLLLIILCYWGYLSIMRYLIKVGVDFNLSDGYYILLIVFCEKGFLILVEELIKEGVDVNFWILLLVLCK